MKRFLIITVIWCSAQNLYAGSSGIRINEFMACNIHAQLNADYSDFVDWIELYNSGNEPAGLNGLFITDDFDDPDKWPLPDGVVIQPKEFFIIWADGLDQDNHASFNLSKSGEQIGLFQANGAVIDTIRYDNQYEDISCGRFPNGGNEWRFFTIPTCNGSNSSMGMPISASRLSPPEFQPEGGLYLSAQLVTTTADAGATIRYTTDGSLPAADSHAYNGAIVVNHTTVLRARTFHTDMLPSETTTHTFVINEPSTVPVICISTPPDFLFDEAIGITVGIPVSDSLGVPPPFDPNANFWNDWERPVHIEYYEVDGDCGFRQTAGIQIFGGMFGRQIRQKAFTLFARDKYGDSDFDYQLFPTKNITKFKRFLLRCSSNDFNRTFIRDAMMQTLVIGKMDVDWQAYQPAVVYINGVFWGLYNIREKTNQYYVESNYNIDADDVDIIEGPGTTAYGDGGHYKRLIEYIQTHDLTLTENYQYVQTQMDVNEFMNYFILQLYVRNNDWLHQNIKCWREHSAGSKWRWLLYDLDWGFSGEIMQGKYQYTLNSIQWALNQGDASLLFQRLLENEAFKFEFAQRFATHLNLTFKPARVHAIIDSMVLLVTPEMPRQIERWGAIRSMAYWQEQLNVLCEFAQERPRYVITHLEETLKLNGTTELSLSVSDSAAGWISVNDIEAPQPAFIGTWFKNISLRIQAHPRYGWRFDHWEGSYLSGKDQFSLTLTDSASMLAVFESADSQAVVISEIHYNPSADLQGDDDIYEFVELVNAGAKTKNISGYRFTKGIDFSFPQSSSMAAGEFVIIAKTAATYSDRGIRVFQMEDGRLDNAGETLCLLDGQGGVVDSVSYNDKTPWPETPDGDGPSLELKSPWLDNNQASAWQASSMTGGTPGSGVLTGVGKLNQVVNSYKLYPVRPNPFNPGTTVTFDVPFSGRVLVHVYNLKGELVNILADGVLDTGTHAVFWDASDRPSGVYFVQLRSGAFCQMRKCLLLK